MGHSAGGLSVTEATHKFAKKIRLVVYVAATMLKLGYMTDEDVKDVKFSKPFLALPLLFRSEMKSEFLLELVGLADSCSIYIYIHSILFSLESFY